MAKGDVTNNESNVYSPSFPSNQIEFIVDTGANLHFAQLSKDDVTNFQPYQITIHTAGQEDIYSSGMGISGGI